MSDAFVLHRVKVRKTVEVELLVPTLVEPGEGEPEVNTLELLQLCEAGKIRFDENTARYCVILGGEISAVAGLVFPMPYCLKEESRGSHDPLEA